MIADDEIIRQVREARKDLAEKHGNDLRRMFLDLKAQEKTSNRDVVDLPPRKVGTKGPAEVRP